jgi:zinc transport system ATP-binding protein
VTKAIIGRDLSFLYADSPIFQTVSFEVRKGEFLGIIGPNGGGKSTLLKLIMGFLSPTSGELNVLGKNLAYVPQNMKFDRHFPISALEVVLQGRLSHLPWYGVFSAEDQQIAVESLKEVGLEEIALKPFGKLSGGQQQRVLIARALASKPEILLLDEPTANLDPYAEKEIFSILRRLKNGMTILMVTHDLQTAVDEVDRILVVQKGILSYSPKEVCEHYALGLYHPPLVKLGGS